MKYFNLKIRSEPIFSFPRWRLLLDCTIPGMKSLAHLVFRLFGRDYDVSARLMSLQGISLPKIGEPPKNCDFARFHLVICILITKLNVTIPVLFKISIKASAHHPPHPHHCPTSTPPHPYPQ